MWDNAYCRGGALLVKGPVGCVCWQKGPLCDETASPPGLKPPQPAPAAAAAGKISMTKLCILQWAVLCALLQGIPALLVFFQHLNLLLHHQI